MVFCLYKRQGGPGYVADRIGYKKTLLVCNIVYVLSKVVFWQATGFGGFLVERLLLSVYACVTALGMVASNLALGRVADVSVAATMGLGAVFCFAGLGLYLAFSSKQ